MRLSQQATLRVLPVCLSVRLSVHVTRAPNWKSERCGKTKIGVNVFQGRSNHGHPHNMSALARHIFLAINVLLGFSVCFCVFSHSGHVCLFDLWLSFGVVFMSVPVQLIAWRDMSKMT